MRYFYFPELPLELCSLSGISMDDPRLQDSKWHNYKFQDWKLTYGKDILEDLTTDGQLNPNIGRWYGNDKKWVVEPGQSRWQALYVLKKKTQKVLIRVDTGELEHLDILKEYEYFEIKTKNEVEKIFNDTSWEDHHGLGYLRRRGWFVE